MKKIFVFFMILSSSAFAECGIHLFKGILRESKTSSLNFHYVVNEQTKSQMTFEFKDVKDLSALMPMLNKPSSFKGKIFKEMDGTKGVVGEIEAINERFPNPLAGADTGIELVTKMKCD